MTQQDQTQKWSSNGGGCGGGGGGALGRSSTKKTKQKKVPQRGLGVAQLEKIIIEEQQRKEAAAASSSSLSSTSKSFLPLQLPCFHHSNQPSSSPIISLHPGTPVDFLRLPHALQNLDTAKPSSCTVPLENTGNFDSTWPCNIQVHHGHENVQKLCNFEKDFVSSMSMNLPYESNKTWPPSNWTQRTQQYHQQPSSSMVNVSSGNLTSPAYHCSKEPPSNQNYSSSCVPMRPEEKKMGLKISYPFSLDVPTATAFYVKSLAFTSNVKSNESTSRAYGTGLNVGAASSSSAFREVPFSCSTPSSSEPNSNKKNENFGEDFLSLAPPISPSKFKSPSTLPAFHNHQELPHFEPPYFQGTEEDQNPHGQQQCLHSFFPAKEAESGQTTEKNRDEGNCNGEKGESDVDLNLKL